MVVPAEDEISAINMVIGAAYAGVRAMTATSGGGFCLMVEGIGLAGMTETPIVVIEGQRPGTCYRLAHTNRAGRFGIYPARFSWRIPAVVFAPATADDCFWLTVKAFNLAEKYQLPVFIITDHYLANSYFTTDKFDLNKVTIDRGLLFTKNQPAENIKDTLLPHPVFHPEHSPAIKMRWSWLIPMNMMKPDI